MMIISQLSLSGQDAKNLIGQLGCVVCHVGLPGDQRVQERSPSLSEIKAKYDGRELYHYFLGSRKEKKFKSSGLTRMPDYGFDASESLALSLFLAGEQQELKALQSLYPEVTKEGGRRIYINQNCGGCHVGAEKSVSERMMAPFLLHEGSRAQRNWLKAFLKKPVSIRPAGFIPGTGSRMPDFKLSDQEAALIADWLMEQKGDKIEKVTLDPELSAFSKKKAEHLIAKRYSCLGCHELGGSGGRIGPNLDAVSQRRSTAYISSMIRNPQHLQLNHSMPKIPMPDKIVDLITAYLVGLKETGKETEGLPLLSLVGEVSLGKHGHGLYETHCAACHGMKGDGDGFNAPFLSPMPANFLSKKISDLSDDTLFEIIHAGGYIFNRSSDMPPWGATLTREEIKSLVLYIRKISKSSGPKWSRSSFGSVKESSDNR
jgi:nitric oxide reductase subunit C